MTPKRSLAILVPLAAAAAALALVPPIPQDPLYHAFADRRCWLGIPNALDVVSNLPFVLAGAVGLARSKRSSVREATRRPYAVFFLGVILTGFGSAYYHLAPDTPRLFWDRLPMTIAFMGLLSATIAERIDPRLGSRLLAPLLWGGIGSVLLWIATEARGVGDLRLYAFVQFGGLLALVLIGLISPAPRNGSRRLWSVVAIYAVAKLLEHFDAAVFAATGVASGHTLKHLVAALAPLVVLSAPAENEASDNIFQRSGNLAGDGSPALNELV